MARYLFAAMPLMPSERQIREAVTRVLMTTTDEATGAELLEQSAKGRRR